MQGAGLPLVGAPSSVPPHRGLHDGVSSSLAPADPLRVPAQPPPPPSLQPLCTHPRDDAAPQREHPAITPGRWTARAPQGACVGTPRPVVPTGAARGGREGETLLRSGDPPAGPLLVGRLPAADTELEATGARGAGPGAGPRLGRYVGGAVGVLRVRVPRVCPRVSVPVGPRGCSYAGVPLGACARTCPRRLQPRPRSRLPAAPGALRFPVGPGVGVRDPPAVRPLLPLFGHFGPVQSARGGRARPRPSRPPRPPRPAPPPLLGPRSPLPLRSRSTPRSRHEQLPVQQGPVLRPLRRGQEQGEPRRGLGATGRGRFGAGGYRGHRALWLPVLPRTADSRASPCRGRVAVASRGAAEPGGPGGPRACGAATEGRARRSRGAGGRGVPAPPGGEELTVPGG